MNQISFSQKQIEDFEKVYSAVGGMDENGMLKISHLGTVMRLCGATLLENDISDYETHIAKPVFSFFDLLDVLSMHFRTEPTSWEEVALQAFAALDTDQSGKISLETFKSAILDDNPLVTYRDCEVLMKPFLDQQYRYLTLYDFMSLMMQISPPVLS